MTLALILIIQYIAANGQIIGVNIQYNIPAERCEVLVKAYTQPGMLARCVEVEPSIEELLAPVEET